MIKKLLIAVLCVAALVGLVALTANLAFNKGEEQGLSVGLETGLRDGEKKVRESATAWHCINVVASDGPQVLFCTSDANHRDMLCMVSAQNKEIQLLGCPDVLVLPQ